MLVESSVTMNGASVRVLCLLSLGSLAVVRGKIYTPCELVRAIENEKDSDSDRLDFDYEKHIALVVCIAGYRRYDTSYKLAHRNDTGYHGIFGIHSSDVGKCYKQGDARGPEPPIDQLRNEVLGGDLRCLAHVILASKATVEYYERLCSPPFVRKVACPLNDYAMTTVFDPIHKDVFERTFGTDEDPLNLLMAMEPGTTLPTTNSPTEPPKTTPTATTISPTKPPKTTPTATTNAPARNNSEPSKEAFHIHYRTADYEQHLNGQESPLNQHPDSLHWTQKITAFTCIIVIFALLLLSAFKIVSFVEKYKANTNSSLRRDYRFDADSQMIHP